MFLVNSKLFLLLVFYINAVSSKEHVPVYMWSTKVTFQRSPALHKISEESFMQSLSEKVKSNPAIVIFAEHTLSPEDFAHHDANGITPFENLHDCLKTFFVDYLPYVQNPIGAIKKLGRGVREVSSASSLHHFKVPVNEILIVNLNDAKDSEQRIQMLQRHDSVIAKMFGELLKVNDNILAIYTSHHMSWLAPEDVEHRNVRSLLQNQNETADSNNKFQSTPEDNENQGKGLIGDYPNLLLYVSSTPLISYDGGRKFTPVDLKVTNCEVNDNNMTFTLSDKNVTINCDIILHEGYWTLSKVSSSETNFIFPELTVPIGFSYHCSNISFINGDETLILPGLQIEPFSEKGQHNFNDAYDCVGFTSIPIWTGIFVTVIMLLILTFGITFMMDIKTMDKFDDAKGKTITINASE